MIENRPRPWKVPTTPPVGDRKERIIGQNAGHEIPLEIEDVLDKKKICDFFLLDFFKFCTLDLRFIN